MTVSSCTWTRRSVSSYVAARYQEIRSAPPRAPPLDLAGQEAGPMQALNRLASTGFTVIHRSGKQLPGHGQRMVVPAARGATHDGRSAGRDREPAGVDAGRGSPRSRPLVAVVSPSAPPPRRHPGHARRGERTGGCPMKRAILVVTVALAMILVNSSGPASAGRAGRAAAATRAGHRGTHGAGRPEHHQIPEPQTAQRRPGTGTARHGGHRAKGRPCATTQAAGAGTRNHDRSIVDLQRSQRDGRPVSHPGTGHPP